MLCSWLEILQEIMVVRRFILVECGGFLWNTEFDGWNMNYSLNHDFRLHVNEGKIKN